MSDLDNNANNSIFHYLPSGIKKIPLTQEMEQELKEMIKEGFELDESIFRLEQSLRKMKDGKNEKENRQNICSSRIS